MRKLVTLGATVALVALAAASGYGWTHWLPVHKAEQEVRKQLRDPESARFEHVKVYPGNNAACGLVNARNSMGGYTGARFFVLMNGVLTLEPERASDGDSTERQIADTLKYLDFLKFAEAFCKPAEGQ